MELRAALALLKLDAPEIRAATREEAQAQLDAWRAETLKPAYRAAAKAAHPDHGGTEQRMRDVLAAKEALDGLHIVPMGPRPRPMPTMVIVVSTGSGTGGASTTVSFTSPWPF